MTSSPYLLAPFAVLAALFAMAACSDDDASLGHGGGGGSAGLGGAAATGGVRTESGGSHSVAGGGLAGEGSGAAAGGLPAGGAGASGGAEDRAGADMGGAGARGSTAGAGGDRDEAGGADAGAGGGANPTCGSTTCPAPLVCVAYRVVGGAVFAPDADGNCESGRHLEPGAGRCARDYSYECRTQVGCDGERLTCDCGAATCPAQYRSCSEPVASSWLEDTAKLVCELQAP